MRFIDSLFFTVFFSVVNAFMAHYAYNAGSYKIAMAASFLCGASVIFGLTTVRVKESRP